MVTNDDMHSLQLKNIKSIQCFVYRPSRTFPHYNSPLVFNIVFVMLYSVVNLFFFSPQNKGLSEGKKTRQKHNILSLFARRNGALNMCCMLPSGGEDLEVCYRKGLVDELPEGKEPAGAPACEIKQETGRKSF